MLRSKALADKILLLGVDGMDPRFTKKMLREGKMPNLQKFIDRGACREDLVMLGGHPTVTPPMWTTLATGCYANVHGITGFDRATDEGLDTIGYNIDSRFCKAELLWNCFAEAGRKTLVFHWPGSSWPPTSDNPNLHVVDGLGPGGCGMTVGQFDGTCILGANKDIKELTFINKGANSATAACVVNGEETEVELGYDSLTLCTSPVAKNVIIDETHNSVIQNTITPVDICQSPIKEATGWTAAPKDALELTVLLSGGKVRRPCLLVKNSDGIYDQLWMYKNKKEAEPFVVMPRNQYMAAVEDDGFKHDEKVRCLRNFKILEMADDGSKVRMFISAAIECNLERIVHPKSLFQKIVDAAGYIPPTMNMSNQDPELINQCMLEGWDYCAEWQAKVLNTMIEKEGFEIIFSHFHNIDIQSHMIIRYMSDKGHNKLAPEMYIKFMEDIYVQTDNYLGQFLHLLDKDWTITIMSDHAQVCAHHDLVLMGDLLGVNVGIMEELGLTTLKRDKDGNRTDEIDWEHTVAVAQRESNIYVNLKGRDKHGIVEPGDKYEVEEEIMTRLYGYRNPATGKRVIALALRNKDAVLLGYGGPECGDICYWLAEGYNWDHADSLSTTYGDAETSVSPIFIGAGKGFKSGFFTDRIIRQIDFAPTIATLGGVRMPAQCEGAPVYQILSEEF